MDGITYFMACEDHSISTQSEEVYSKDGKRKYKKKYKMLEYVSFVRRKAMLKYSWNDCMRDMKREYGNEETAAKVCSAIKNKTVQR